MPFIPKHTVEPPLVVTLDVGTSSVRALLFDRFGRGVEGVEGRRAYEMQTTPDGGVEADAEALFDRVQRSLDDLLEQAGPLQQRIGGVAVSTFWHNVLGVDSDASPLTPVYSWADTRSAALAAELKGRLDEKAVHARTGCRFHPSYLPAKLLWLSRRDPERFRRVSRWISFGEYLALRLFGRTLVSISMASGTGLLNQHTLTWDEEVMNALPIRVEQLSPLGDMDTPFIGLQGAFAQRWPALKEVPWFPAVGDGACSNLGSGCISLDRVALMVGTSGAMRVLGQVERVMIPWGLFGYRADRQRWVMGGALSNGGNFFEWLRTTLQTGSPEEIERGLLALEPDAHGLTILPFLAGERSPGWAAEARAAIVGLRLPTRPLEIMRAGLEAVGYRFALIYQLLKPLIPETHEIIASGGALLRSPAWIQIMADVLGHPITASTEAEASSRGAALLALEALGALPDLREAPISFGQTYLPDPDRHERYQRALERQQKLYDLLVNPTPEH